MKIVNKLVKNLSGYGSKKEETLSSIFKPLNGIEEKVTIRQAVIKEKILLLEEDMTKIEDQITAYEEELKRCDQYLDNLSKFSGIF